MKKQFKILLLLILAFWAHSLVAQDRIPLNTSYSFEASYSPGYSYSWWYVDETNNKTYFTSSTNKTEEYYWDKEGEYELFVQATDTNNCLSEIITKRFVVFYESEDLDNIAGRDSTIASCAPYTLGGIIKDENNYNFLWKPGENLDDPTSATPLFTPGNTSEFTLTVTDKNNGKTTIDTVEITVLEIMADAGDDILINTNSTTVLDGSRSIGEGLSFYWTTNSGTIESGENTPTPLVNSPGKYYLEITDKFACVAIDSVEVSLITFAPIANDDYDTTAFQVPVKILVLDNDTDPDSDIDSTSLIIVQSPINGSAYIDYNDNTLVYTPGNGFVGNDVIEYSICDKTKKCSNAHVYVVVNNFNFLIPNAFTPNGDNINDYFEITGIEYYYGNSIKIINRWGKKVYETQNYGIDTYPKYWDGKSNTDVIGGNNELPSGTYFYILDLGNGQKPIAGSIYIDR